MPKLKVIYDTDPGVDDAMALLLMARHPDVEVVGIVSSFGNGTIDTTTRNALYLKQRFALVAPVARGAAGPITGAEPSEPPTYVHGDNGLGNIELPPVTATEDPRPAHKLIIDLLRESPGQITIIAVGRMTNLALALAEAPEVAQLARRIVVMGGAFGRNGHYGNVTPVAEANIWGDPAAADIVFGAAWPVTIVPLDVTHETVMSDSYVNDLADAAGEDGRFVRAISLFYQGFYKDTMNIWGFPVHDSSAVAFALHPEFYTTETGAIRVVSEGIAFGQTIIKPDNRSYPPGAWDNRPSQTIVTGVNAPAVLDFYRRTLLGEFLMFGSITRITATAGKRDELIAILAPGEGSLPGCLSYIVARDPKDADVLYVTEAWETAEAHAASLQLPEVQAAIARGRPLIAKFELIAETEPVGGVGLGVGFDNP